MKKLFFMLACAASVGAYVYSPQAPEKADDLTLENIETVGLSAGEAICDCSNDQTCTITNNEEGIKLTSTGRAVMQF